ncbi:MAG: ATP-binding protein, partial [Ginsengibacter sp.]
TESCKLCCAFTTHGCIEAIGLEPLSENEAAVLQRFAKVFEQTYTRFLDLQRAEYQAREATIEAALEKIRSRSLAMHRPDELKDVIATIFQKLKELNVLLDTVAIWLFNKATKDSIFWVGNNLQQPTLINLPYDEELMKENTNYKDSWQAFLSGESYLNKEYSEEEKNRYFKYVFAHNDLTVIPQEGRDFLTNGKKYIACLLVEQNSSLYFDCWNGQLYSEESIGVLRRVAKVFEQAYIRFLDLQKAEAQAREAHIETALEKVRSRTMAMYKSDELADAAEMLFKQISTLGNKTDRLSINLIDEQQGICDIWATDQEGVSIKVRFKGDLNERTTFKKLYEAWKMKYKSMVVHLRGEELREWLNYVRLKIGLAIDDKYIHADRFHNVAFFSSGWMMFSTGEPVGKETMLILERFASVFNLTYTRFLDLQKAEAQAREAKVEAALERVRTAAMAMHSSEGLLQVTQVLREQVALLGEKELESILIHIYNEKTNYYEAWYSYRHPDDPQGGIVNGKNTIDWASTARTREDKERYYGSNQDYTIVADKKMLQEWYEYLFNTIPEVIELSADGKILVPDILYYNYSRIAGGAVVLITNSEASPHSKDLLSRAAKVFSLAYSRFLDLQTAEAQNREAQIQLALERIRSRSLAMHHSNELKDVVAILFQQLKVLGLAFDGGAAITLFKDNSKDAVILVASPLTPPVRVNLPYDEEAFLNNPIILDVWQAKETGENIFNRFYSFEEKNKYFRYVFKHNGLEILPQPARDFILQADSYTASFIAEKNSLLGANSWNRQVFSEKDFDILKRVAKVFEQAYIRFLDLQKAEALALRAEQDLVEIKAARKRAENTLIELKATQAQLIQSEKMASLGELTAGIAHEIQNPLNFVNNFSDVNKELLEELKHEAENGNIEEIKAIATNIISNEEKINHHGKRADAIVKGMLQHSRKSNTVKEPADINALCNEFLRISYHGLRAKNVLFNAAIKTDFDPAIGKIKVIQQDIGRLLLNIFNNAFYAVAEKKRQQPDNYEPCVSVSTKKINDRIEIKISDNGNGIPQNILDKIFQPFFTTKPTGQGTGLGLSLSYDIIKAHGGEIKVGTKEGEGTEFII